MPGVRPQLIAVKAERNDGLSGSGMMRWDISLKSGCKITATFCWKEKITLTWKVMI
jgi:hypothetical protein